MEQNTTLLNFNDFVKLIEESEVSKDKKILSKQNLKKYLFNKKNYTTSLNFNEIDKILFNICKITHFDSTKIPKELHIYFCLYLIIKKDLDNNKVSLLYSIDLIKDMHSNNKSSKTDLRKILVSKIIIYFIKYYKGLSYYNESQNLDLNKINEENINIIKDNISILKDLNLKTDTVNKIIDISIDKIYIDIILSLIKSNKFIDFDYIINIISQLDLENIIITKSMLELLNKILDTNNNVIKKYQILNIEDLFNNEKINFYYILIKYIIKNQMYIYNIPFLLNFRRRIIRFIKNNLYLEVLPDINIDNIDIKIKDTIKMILDNKYYYKIFLNYYQTIINIINNKHKREVYENKIKNINEKHNIANNILILSNFVIGKNQRSVDPFSVIDKIFFGVNNLQMPYKYFMETKEICMKYQNIRIFNYFYKFITLLEKIIEETKIIFVLYNDKYKIKLSFKRIRENEIIKDSIIILCIYRFCELVNNHERQFVEEINLKNEINLKKLKNFINDNYYHMNTVYHISLNYSSEKCKIDDSFQKENNNNINIVINDHKVFKNSNKVIFIINLSLGLYLYYGTDNILVISDVSFNQKIIIEEFKNSYIDIKKINAKEEKNVKLYIESKENLFLITLDLVSLVYNIENLHDSGNDFNYKEKEKEKEKLKQKQNLIIIDKYIENSHFNYKEIIENKTNNKYIKKLIEINDNSKLIYYKNIKPDDELLFYCYIKEKIKKITGYKDIKSHLIIPKGTIKGNKTKLLFSCKKNKSNGILLIIIHDIDDSEDGYSNSEMISEFYNTNDFEIYSFYPFQINLDNIRNNNDNNVITRSKSNKINNVEYINNTEIVISAGDVDVKKDNEANIFEYFLAGGLNKKTKKPIMILYELIFNNISFKIQFEEIQKLELDNIENNDEPFTNIIQANNKNNNNIFITSQGEKIHLFSYTFK